MRRIITRGQAVLRVAEEEMRRLGAQQRADWVADWWGTDRSDPWASIIPDDLMRRMEEEDPPEQAEDPLYDPLLVVASATKLRGVTNDYLGRRLSLASEEVVVVGDEEPMQPCPCCGSQSLPARDQLEICPVCYWEDDGTLLETAHSAPNHSTLGEARRNFSAHGAANPELRKFIAEDAPTRYRH